MNKSSLKLTFTLLSSLWLLTSCGMPLVSKKNDLVNKPGVTTKLYAQTNSSFADYIAAFEESAGTQLGNPYYKVGDIPINFGTPENETFDGVCYTYGDGSKEIIIRQSFWNSASAIQRRVLVFHELGHCALGRAHDNETVEHSGKTYKASMMNEVIPSSMHFLSAENEYLTELFTLNKTPLKQKIDTF